MTPSPMARALACPLLLGPLCGTRARAADVVVDRALDPSLSEELLRELETHGGLAVRAELDVDSRPGSTARSRSIAERA